MASSKSRQPNKLALTQSVKEVLEHLFFFRLTIEQPLHLLVGLSGGIDSVVLLHILQQLSRDIPLQISVGHIHHGLSPFANDWQRFCAHYTGSLHLPFNTIPVHVPRNSGLGIEAAARQARYAALQQLRQQLSADVIVTAHHQQDQAETLLLQLSRGAGVKGLSSMAAYDADACLLRPLLAVDKTSIVDYARAHGLDWIEDDSNSLPAFDRNFLRHQVMPVWRSRYPQLDAAITRAAMHLADAQHCLAALASIDMQACEMQAAWMGQSMALQPMQQLGEVRGKNLLRYWLQQQGVMLPSQRQLQICWQQIVSMSAAGTLSLSLRAERDQARFFFAIYRARLYLVRHMPALPQTPLVWNGDRQQQWGAWQVSFSIARGCGVALARLGIDPAHIQAQGMLCANDHLSAALQLMLHQRQGAERIRPISGRPQRSLKVLFQNAEIPPWQRDHMPVISVRMPGHAIRVIGLYSVGLDHEWQALPSELGLNIRLQP